MDKELDILTSILKQKGYTKIAQDLDKKRIRINMDPLSAAVALGLLDQSVLSAHEDVDKEQDEPSAFEELLEDLKEEVTD